MCTKRRPRTPRESRDSRNNRQRELPFVRRACATFREYFYCTHILGSFKSYLSLVVGKSSQAEKRRNKGEKVCRFISRVRVKLAEYAIHSFLVFPPTMATRTFICNDTRFDRKLACLDGPSHHRTIRSNLFLIRVKYQFNAGISRREYQVLRRRKENDTE